MGVLTMNKRSGHGDPASPLSGIVAEGLHRTYVSEKKVYVMSPSTAWPVLWRFEQPERVILRRHMSSSRAQRLVGSRPFP